MANTATGSTAAINDANSKQSKMLMPSDPKTPKKSSKIRIPPTRPIFKIVPTTANRIIVPRLLENALSFSE
jgi:hypothetical protein